MKFKSLVAAMGVAVTTLLSTPASALDEKLPMYNKTSGISGNFSSVGSDTLANMMTFWAEEYKRIYPNVNIQIQAGQRICNFVRASVNRAYRKGRRFVYVRAANRVPVNAEFIRNCLAVVFAYAVTKQRVKSVAKCCHMVRNLRKGNYVEYRVVCPARFVVAIFVHGDN